MYFTDRSLLPENQPPLIITAAPYGPSLIPSDFPEDIPVTWDEQVQKAIDCFEAGARILHIHVRDPETGKISKDFDQYADQIGRLRDAVNKMVHIAEELGRPLATPEETRQILKLGTWYDTPNETLFNLGLPPVREEGERGFLTYETNEGRLHAPLETPADPRTVL